MVIEYNDLVIEHFRNPRNVGVLEDCSVEATDGSPACGDMLTMYLKIEDCVIVDVRFKSYGCASNIATASMLTEIIKGRSVEFAKNVGWKDVVRELGGLPSIKTHCSVLAIDVLKKAINSYEFSC